MASEQAETLRVVTAAGVVEARSMPSGVTGLALVGPPVSDRWRLVHVASGRAVSRSAEHSDPDAVRELAQSIASLANWNEPSIAVVVPGIREKLERAISKWHLEHPDKTRPTSVLTPARRGEAQDLSVLLHAAQRECSVLRKALRMLRAAMGPADFADALASLPFADREVVHSLVSEVPAGQVQEPARDSEKTAVVQSLRREGAPPSRMPTRQNKPRTPGSDVAAS